jgi:choice-of-anchor B domain-containing protein
MLLLPLAAAPPAPAAAQAVAEEPPPHEMHEPPSPGDAVGGIGELVQHLTPCIGGMAGGFPCSNVDLLEHMPTSTIGGGNGNDIWGWTDPLTGNEYALMGRTNGTAFVDVTDPENAVYLGNLPTHTGNSAWRDIKVYADHAFIVSDNNGAHGMQVFDLTQLRTVVSPPVTFTETAHYSQGNMGSCHNIAINEDSGYAYAVGCGGSCSSGLHMIDISTPTAPVFAGCFSADGYTHDTQCVNYAGPDPDYAGREICFSSNTDTLTIVDVTNKAAPVQVSRTGYAGVGYTHQGWLTADQVYFLLDDEADESNQGHNTRTRIWDVSDLDEDGPFVLGTYTGPVAAIDHNLYTHNGFVFEANYRSGLRILSLADVANGNLTEVGFFDIYPANDNRGFQGAWSVYPYFDSGTVVVSGIGEGLFVLRPNLCSDPAAPTGLAATPAGDNEIDLAWSGGGPGETFNVYRALGACPGASPEQIATDVAGTAYDDVGVSGQLEIAYVVTASDPTGLCESPPSDCASATTTGPCTAAPTFAGLEEVTSPGQTNCVLELSWTAGGANCGPGVSYSVYRATDPQFVPAPANRIALGLTGTSYADVDIETGISYTYVVRATDTGNGSEDGNLVRVTGTPAGPLVDGTFATGGEIGDPPFYFDSPSGGGTERHVGWHPSEARVHGGSRSYFSTYENEACIAVVSPPIELAAGEPPVLRFWTVFDVAAGDGGVVELSADGGESWTGLALAPPYPGSFDGSADACGYSTGRPAFTGGTDLTWTEHAADLSPWAGSEILVRWMFSTDGAGVAEGWYIDDVEISHARVAGACITALFADGFESGDASVWSSSVGMP